MGKKGKVVTKASAAPTVSAAPAPASSAATTTSSSASANSYQSLIRALFSIPEGASDEKTEILQKLASEYKALATTNRLNAQKEKLLAEELAQTAPQFSEVSAEATTVKTEHDNLSAKYNKLRQLSLQLSDRTKQADLKAATRLQEEQQKRVKFTENFSASIAAISSKLDTLESRRVAVVTENMRLKALLKSYLEEYDALEGKSSDPDKLPAPPAKGANAPSAETPQTQTSEPAKAAASEMPAPTGPVLMVGVEDAVQPPPPPAGPVFMEGVSDVDQPAPTAASDASEAPSTGAAQEEPTAADAPAQAAEPAPAEAAAAVPALTPEQVAAQARQLAEQQAAEQAELQSMQDQEDLTRLAQLRAREEQLRQQSAQYAAQFDAFQVRLSECSKVFSSKQASIERLVKEVTALEKENAALAKKTADVVLSTKVTLQSQANLLVEQDKQQKLIERYRGLTELLQKEMSSGGSGAKSAV